ncbi:MAG TPA: carboxypeptidase-like regulatory domain-containing protein [Mucilaginibacter sp.]|nr:carboxypeptidase-like regulatory domain-containing protein [Mucilaginibacter sp.]
MNLAYRILICGFLVGVNIPAFGQSKTRLDLLINRFNDKRRALPVEKLYLHTDKDNYLQGDSIWFKAYLLDADYLMPSPRSGLLYVELDNAVNACVKRIMVPLADGLSWGQIALTNPEFPPGSYTLRAYTSWMRNFGEDYIFRKNIYVAAAGDKQRLVNAAFGQTGNILKADLLITGRDGRPLRLHDIRLKVQKGKNTLQRKTISTGVDGRMVVDFDLPENTHLPDLTIIASEPDKKEKADDLIIPVFLDRPENIDLQFMPEGGALLAGVKSRVGFKAIREDGLGVQVTGGIYDSRNRMVATFSALHKGIGSFELQPEQGETYTARLNLPDGVTKNYPLPVVATTGTGLRVINPGVDSIELQVTANAVGAGGYNLVAESRGVACYGAHLNVKTGTYILRIAKSLLPTGITRFTLLNAAGQPLNERLVFINHHDELNMAVSFVRQTYAPHDSVSVQLSITNKDGQPVRGSFSLAVTDDSQVRTDSLGANILSGFLLTSDLKGTVEEPGYYFTNNSPGKVAALDDLLLTQGWVGYSWNDLDAPKANPEFAAEKQFTVQGSVTNAVGKGLSQANVVLLSKKPALTTEAVTDATGRFIFKGIAPVDTAAFVIQARRKNGSSFNVNVDVNEFKPPVFSPSLIHTRPWYVNSDTLLLRNGDRMLSQQSAAEKLEGMGTVLKEVVVKDKKIIKDSKNLNGPGQADVILDEKDLEKSAKLSLYDLMRQRFPSFYKYVQPPPLPPKEGQDTTVYMFKGHRIYFVIDGVFIGKLGLQEDLYMRYLNAEDVKGIEVMYNPKYAIAYDPDFVKKTIEYKGINVPVYFEITTYSGHGAFMKKTPGLYIYKPLPFSLSKQFYRPKYAAGAPVNGTDERSTIHWEPNIVTDSAGCATVSFYTAERPSAYTIIIQGTDLNGQLGYAWKKISVKRLPDVLPDTAKGSGRNADK